MPHGWGLRAVEPGPLNERPLAALGDSGTVGAVDRSLTVDTM